MQRSRGQDDMNCNKRPGSVLLPGFLLSSCPPHCSSPACSETMLGSLRTCAARRPANLMATSFARRTKAGSAESVTSSVSLPPDPSQHQRSIGDQFRCSCGWFCTGILLPFATVNSSDPTLFHHLSSPFNALRCCSIGNYVCGILGKWRILQQYIRLVCLATLFSLGRSFAFRCFSVNLVT